MTTPTMTDILCRQCRAPLAVEQGSAFVNCEFCGTTNHLDKAEAIFHYVVRTTVRENDAVAALRRWMAGNDTVKGLDEKAQIGVARFELFPMWLARVTQGSEEKVLLEPAAALSVSELRELAIPAADLEPFEYTGSTNVVEPTVPYTAMQTWLKEHHNVEQSQVKEVALVHLPIYVIKYEFDGRSYTAMVDAATSKVFANIFPSKWEAPYTTIAAIAFVLYFLASLIPLGSFLFGGGAAFGVGLGVYCGAVVVLAVPIFIVAAVISAKV